MVVRAGRSAFDSPTKSGQRMSILSRSVLKGGNRNADAATVSNPPDPQPYSLTGTRRPPRLLPPCKQRKDGAPFVRYESKRSNPKARPPADFSQVIAGSRRTNPRQPLGALS